MSRILLCLFFLGTLLSAQNTANSFFDKTDRFLAKYIKDNRVDYAALVEDRTALDQLLKSIAQIDISAFSSTEEKAFRINAYNLLVIHSVVEKYPLRSPQDVGGFFDRQKHTIAGENLTLNDLERKTLLEKFHDPRLHFALVCAAVGCPSIIPEAYRSENLDAQLEKRTRMTLNNDFHVKVNAAEKKVSVSEIFKWYKSEFTTGGQSIIQYINPFRNTPIPEDFSVDYITYDWTLNEWQDPNADIDFSFIDDNLQGYTPSTLLRSGQIEVKQFNNLYTQTAFYDGEGNRTDQDSRSNFFTSSNSFLYGINGDVNIGFDMLFKAVRNDREGSSPFATFKFQSDNNARVALSHIGPKIKLTPFSGLPGFAFQTSLLLPLVSDLDGSESDSSPFVDFDGVQWWTQFFLDKTLSDASLLYLESGLFFRFGSDFEDFYTPIKAIFNYYPSQKWTFYIPTEFTPFWNVNPEEGNSVISGYYAQLGGGVKYQLSDNFELETLYTNFIFGENQGAGQTFNLGLRIIR